MCPDLEILDSFVCGTLLPAERGRVERHVDACSACRAQLELVRANLAALPAVSQVLSAGRASVDMPNHPDRIASFRILRELGRGGMGVVYLAEQDRPRRAVALKLLQLSMMTAGTRRRFEQEAELLLRIAGTKERPV